MRISRILCALVASSLAATACSSDSNDDAQTFPTLQACYDEHTQNEGFDTQKAIVTCCIDHPIGDTDHEVHPSCGMSKADCVEHVAANLTEVAASDVDTACQTYIEQLAE
jgi:hypothetical protein